MWQSNSSSRRATLTGALLLAALTLGLLCPRAAMAGPKIGWFGLSHDMRVEGYFGRGERWANAGNQLYLQFSGAFFGKSSPMGNLAGIEFDMGLGYDGIGYKDNDTVLGDIGFPMHLSVGFPITLWRLFGGRGGRVQLGFSPGFGINWQVAYTYLKLNAAVRITRGLAVEGTYTWWPGAASASVADTNASVNMAAARATVYFRPRRRRGRAFLVFIELMQSQREEDVATGGNQSKTLYDGQDPFGSTKRQPYEAVTRVGVGYAF